METLVQLEQAAKVAELALGDLHFYLLSFALACVAGLVRSYRDHHYRDYGNLVSIGLCSGFIGLGCVLMLGWVSGGRFGHEPGLIAAAIFIGLMGKEADRIYPKVIEWVLKKIGVELPPEDSKGDPKVK